MKRLTCALGGLRPASGVFIPTAGLSPLSCVRRFILYAVLPLIFCYVGAAEEVVCPAHSTSSFFASVANTTCDVVLITGGGFVLSQLEVSQLLATNLDHRVVRSRSLTLRGETKSTVLDFGYLKRRIILQSTPGGESNVLTVESLILVHVRQPSATSAGGFDVLSADEDTLLYVRDSVIVYGMCAPMSAAARYGARVPRPSGVPGSVQIFTLINDKSLCLPGLRNVTARAGPGLSSDLQVASDCFDQAFVMIDYAVLNTRLDPQGQRIVSGSVWYINTSYVCEHAATDACMLANGNSLTVCAAAVIDAAGLRRWDTYDLETPSPPLPPFGGGSKGTNVLAVVLPCVLGGLALIGATTGVALWWRQRRRREVDTKTRQYALESGGAFYGGEIPAASAGRNTSRVGSAAPSGVDCMAAVDGAMLSPQGIHIAAMESGGAANIRGTGAPSWADPASPKWAAANGGAHFSKANGHFNGGTGPPAIARSGTMSSVQSASITNTGTSLAAALALGNGGGGGPSGGGPSWGAQGMAGSSVAAGAASGVLEGNLLGNPLLGQGSGQGSSQGGVALNMVLGVDVFASREAVLGRGTFATVLQGNLGGRPVAVKMFHRDALGSTADDVKSLKQEIAILARCQHPNVVALLGAGSTSGGDEVFLVEELMSSNLARVIHEGDGLPLYNALCVARDIATGLAYLHPTVIHRDLKPANVLLDRNGTAKLTDFGLSRLWASTVHTANPEAGTVQYMAPECFSGSLTDRAPGKIAITHLSDVYSFGVMLWEMLAKERPWKGLTSIQVALMVGYEQQRLKIPEGDSDRFHPKLRKLIAQCWEADPRKRPGAAEIAKRLSLLIQRIETYGSIAAGDSVATSARAGSGAGSFSGDGLQACACAALPVSSSSLDAGPESAANHQNYTPSR